MRVLAALPNPCQIMGLCNRDINQTFVTELNLVGDPDKLMKEICDGFYGSPFINANGLTKARAIGMAWKDGRQLQFMLGFQNDRDVALVAVRNTERRCVPSRSLPVGRGGPRRRAKPVGASISADPSPSHGCALARRHARRIASIRRQRRHRVPRTTRSARDRRRGGRAGRAGRWRRASPAVLRVEQLGARHVGVLLDARARGALRAHEAWRRTGWASRGPRAARANASVAVVPDASGARGRVCAEQAVHAHRRPPSEVDGWALRADVPGGRRRPRVCRRGARRLSSARWRGGVGPVKRTMEASSVRSRSGAAWARAEAVLGVQVVDLGAHVARARRLRPSSSGRNGRVGSPS